MTDHGTELVWSSEDYHGIVKMIKHGLQPAFWRHTTAYYGITGGHVGLYFGLYLICELLRDGEPYYKRL